MLDEWSTELKERIIPTNTRTIRRLKKLHDENEITDLDIVNWERISNIKHNLMKDSMHVKSIFSQIRDALDSFNYSVASNLQIEMNAQMSMLTKLYLEYRRNLIILDEH